MNDLIINFSVRELLIDKHSYCVPMYQRNYAWGEGEINQLIQDVLDIQERSTGGEYKQPYYIGTLVVYERADGSFEVIDGQQRFTTLTLMALCLKRLEHRLVDMQWYAEPNLLFESRPISTQTLTSLSQGIALDRLRNDQHNQDLVNGFSLLEKRLLKLGVKLNSFCEYLLDHVKISRVPVPRDTDLNHYFEAMNSRGEQLEKHEIVKAQLMAVLNDIKDDDERNKSLHALATVWDATSNMERYVQYGFSAEQRHTIFGKNDWGQFSLSSFGELISCLSSSGKKSQSDNTKSMSDILKCLPASTESNDDSSTPERFNSIINFSNFLLQVLRAWTKADVALDDKQLIDQFELHILKTDNAIQLTKDFVFVLLKAKYLFDQYIIKREFLEGEDKWSLKRLCYYNKNSQSYINTFSESDEDGFNGINRRLLMLLSALHVSTPTQVYKHWLNGALDILFSMAKVNASEYLTRLESLTRKFVYGRYLNVAGGAEYFDMIYGESSYAALDVDSAAVKQRLKYSKIENNLVFNYLDYLLWCNAKSNKTTNEVINQYEFTFRSSVEHFYPQHPMDGHQKLEQASLHSFGNLCLISHSKNSRLSNFQPNAKRDHFKAAINEKKIDSLKLYEMIRIIDITKQWGITEIEQHENKMLEILIADSKQGALENECSKTT